MLKIKSKNVLIIDYQHPRTNIALESSIDIGWHGSEPISSQSWRGHFEPGGGWVQGKGKKRKPENTHENSKEMQSRLKLHKIKEISLTIRSLEQNISGN